MENNLIRKITITEEFSSNGRRIREISQSFESRSGGTLSYENAETVISGFRQSIHKDQPEKSQSEFVLPCLETVRELIYAILAFPEPLGSDRTRLSTLVFGSADFDALSLEKPESGSQAEQNGLDGQLQRVSSAGLLADLFQSGES